MSYRDWTTCTSPKIQGSWNLHNLLPRNLDFFIMLASMSGVIGNPGQANYSAGNTFEDALALHRHRQGLPATALDLGAVRDVGYLAESGDQKYWTMSHINQLMISEADIHFLVRVAITGHSAGDETTPTQVVSGLMGAAIDDRILHSSRWMRDGKLAIAFRAAGSSKSAAAAQVDIQALLNAETVTAAAAIIEDVMVKRVATALMIPEEDISPSEPLQVYGCTSVATFVRCLFDANARSHSELARRRRDTYLAGQRVSVRYQRQRDQPLSHLRLSPQAG